VVKLARFKFHPFLNSLSSSTPPPPKKKKKKKKKKETHTHRVL
jgi:hypothetical protein